MTLSRAQGEAFRSRVRGCLLGGAIGDALGAPLEFGSLDDIRATYGTDSVREYQPVNVAGGHTYGLVTDDTQMTLFTVEGLIRAGIRRDRGLGFTVAMVHDSLGRWLDTQSYPAPPADNKGWLASQRWLYSRRAPGNTCLGALRAARGDMARPFQYGGQAVNNSKGCGGVMRSAPFGLIPTHLLHVDSPVATLFDWAVEAAGYTHGHPTGKLASGAMAAIVSRLVDGDDLPTAAHVALDLLAHRDHHEETSDALRVALHAADRDPPTPETVERLGGGWVAEQALSIAVYAALAHPAPEEFLDALSLAVTHSGDSDSTGAICGNILGAWHGETALPAALAFEVEGRGTILQLADDFVWEFTVPGQLHHNEYGPEDTRWVGRY